MLSTVMSSKSWNISPAGRIVLVYLMLGMSWVLILDLFLSRIGNGGNAAMLSIVKGWLFVFISAALLYHLIQRHVIKQELAGRIILASEERLNLVLQSVNDGVWDWDLKSGQAYLSPKYYEIAGFHPEEIVPDLAFFLSLVHPEDREMVIGSMNDHLDGRSTASVFEFRMVTRQGDLKWILGRGKVVERDAVGQPLRMLGTITDISERKKIERELQESEKRYRVVVEDQTEIICRFLPGGTLTFVNAVYCRLFGKSQVELLGRSWQPQAFTEDVPQIEKQLKRMSSQHPVVVVENRIITGSGEVRWMQFVNRGFYDENGTLLETQVVGRDITVRKKAEESMRQYAHRLLELEEEMRKKLAEELHNEIGRDLTALGLNIAMMHGSLPVEMHEKLDERFEDMGVMLESISRTVRGLMSKLRPPVLDDYGLSAALRWHCELFSKRSGLAVELSVEDGFPRMSTDRELAIFRIAQEAMTNISKHANARTVRISLVASAAVIRLAVSDDGDGFDAANTGYGREGSHWGLTMMRERAEAANGHFRLETSIGAGTKILAELGREA